MMELLLLIVLAIAVWLLISLMERILELQSERAIKKMPKDVDPRILEDSKYAVLRSDGDCLRGKVRQKTFEMRWADVEQAAAFKRDLLSVDLICLAFKMAGKEEYYEINEQMVGYHDLLQLLPEYLPGFPAEWMSRVILPPFATNYQVIWKRLPGESATGA